MPVPELRRLDLITGATAVHFKWDISNVHQLDYIVITITISLDEVLGQKTVAKTLRIFKKEDLDLDNANYVSCLRPMSGDDIPIIGEKYSK